MELIDLIVLLSGIAIIISIYWFFFGKRDDAVIAGDEVRITVQGGYKPDVIKVQKDKPVKLLITRKDENSCLEEIVFPEYKVKKFLPLNEEVEIVLKPPHKNSDFHCGMNMYFGKIVID
jgi:plastocyanin domain-containing protein